jgi:protein SCO1/2
MSSGIRNTLLGCFAFMALMLGLFINNMFREPVLSDAELREKGIVLLPTPRQVAPFALVGEDGAPFTEADLVGGWTLAYFGFTSCPDICPVALSVLAEGRRRLEAEGGPDFRGLLVSVDPERDTPERLREYVSHFDPSFRGVTGTVDIIETLGTQVSVAFAKVSTEDGDYTIDHTGNVVIFNPQGDYLGLLRMPQSPGQIELAIKTLARRAGEG